MKKKERERAYYDSRSEWSVPGVHGNSEPLVVAGHDIGVLKAGQLIFTQ